MKYKTFASGFLLASALLVASNLLSQVERDDRPDLIVSDLRNEGDMLVLEIQNQGPGTAGGTITASVRGSGMSQPRTDSRKDIQLEAPRATRATVTHRIPLAEFGIPANGEFSMMFHIALDTANAVNEASEGNNSFSRQLDYSRSWRKVPPPRATYTNEGPLPDLVITEIVHDGTSVTASLPVAAAAVQGTG